MLLRYTMPKTFHVVQLNDCCLTRIQSEICFEVFLLKRKHALHFIVKL